MFKQIKHKDFRTFHYGVVFIVVLLVLTWYILHRHEEQMMRSHHENTAMSAQKSVAEASYGIELYINELRRSARLLVEKNISHLNALVKEPELENSIAVVRKDMRNLFPEAYDFVVASSKGVPVSDPFGEIAGPLCQSDIKSFAQSGRHTDVYIHPGPSQYHIDITANWQYANSAGIFSLNIDPKSITRILRTSESIHYTLVLRHTEPPDLIEITSQGIRSVKSDSIRLEQTTLKSLLADIGVKNTRWRLSAIPISAPTQRLQDELKRRTLFILVLFLFGALVVLRLIFLEAKRRYNLGQKLLALHANQERTIKSRTEALTKSFLELKESELERLQLSQAVEQSGDLIFITDPEGLIEYVNPSFEKITGYKKSEIIGKKPSILKSGMQSQAIYQQLWNIIEQGRAFQEVLINRRKNGELFYEDKSITPIKDASGRIIRYLSTGKDITARMQLEERLNYLSNYDPLTELPNDALLKERISHAIEQCRRKNCKIVLMLIRISNLDTIIDSYGHSISNHIIVKSSESLKKLVRDSDTLSRSSGDSFSILLEDIDQPVLISKLADTLIREMRLPLKISSLELVLDVNLGIALWPADGNDPDSLRQSAHSAVRNAEQNNSSYEYYTNQFTQQAQERMAMYTELKSALVRNEFTLNYQPQWSLDNQKLSGAEVLLRWHNARLGNVSPAKFIPLAEETGLIIDIGEWVLAQSCRQAKTWVNKEWLNGLKISVNVSGVQLKNQRVAEVVEQLLNDIQLNAEFLELEITESTVMTQTEQAIACLSQLRNLGVELAIDDFGTGFSSLSYLQRLPVNRLKLDRSFIFETPHKAGAVSMTKSIIGLGKSLNLAVVAEGIETQEQATWLARSGCEYGQGYYYAKPMPCAEFESLLKSNT